MADEAQLAAVTILVDDLKSEDTEVRIAAMRKIGTVAQVLGPEQTRSELIPRLNEQVEDDDEVLLVMAEELGRFIPLVGGPAEAVCLIRPLRMLAMVEETVVRDKAVESACTVIAGLRPAAIIAEVVPAIESLAQGDWFTARVSAAGLVAATYARLGAPGGDAAAVAEAKRALRALFAQLCGDETPMVRRAAAKHIGALAGAVEHDAVASDLLPLFLALSGDEQDSVRLLAVDSSRAFAAVLTQAEAQTHILPLFIACANDKSWRVRHAVAKEFAPLSRSMGASVARSELLLVLVRLLHDPEGEVRAAAARNVSGVASLVGYDVFQTEVLPAVVEAVGDPTQAVRVAAMDSLMALAATLTHAQAEATVVPHVVRALNDKEEAPEVRLAVLEALAGAAPVLGAEVLAGQLLDPLVQLGQDPLWRVREKVLSQLPLLAQTLGSTVFQERLLALYMGCFQDQVHAVRLAATRCLEPLTRHTGADWAVAHLLPRLQELFAAPQSSYLQRITVLYGARELSVHPPLAACADAVLSTVISALRDDVPNVRFVAAQVLADAIGAGTLPASRIAGEVRPALAAMAKEDPDADARYFAAVALEKAAA